MVRAARKLVTAAAAILAVAVAGCGVGEGEADPGSVSLTVTRDYGSEVLLEAESEDPPASQTVVRLLDREAEIETSYGDNFVDAIDGLSGRIADGRSEDWFFYVNGYWSPVGAGEAKVRAGDRIWWDYRDWTDAYRVSAVVGSWPEPFVHGSGGERIPTEVVCFDVPDACAQTAERLRSEGAEVTEVDGDRPGSDPGETLRVLVGSWAEVRSDRAAAGLERGPGSSGVYGRPLRCDGGFGLEVLDDHAERVSVYPSAAWIAALGGEDGQPTWVVSGSNADGVRDAVAALEEEALADRYAVAIVADTPQPMPAFDRPAAQPASEEGCR